MSDRTRLRDGFYWRGSVIWTRVQGRRRSTGHKDPQAAYLWRARKERELADPRHAAAAKVTVASACTLYRDALKAAGRSAATLSAYATKLGHFTRVLGRERALSTIDPALVEGYWSTRAGEGAGALTRKQEITLLIAVLRWAKHKGWFAGDVDGLRPPLLAGEYVPRTAWLTPDEVKALVAELPEHRAAWVALAIATAGRHSEVNRARVEDFDLEGGTMLVRGTKTKTKHRRVSIPDFARPLIEFAIRHGAGTGGLVLRPWTRSNAATTLKAACTRAKVRRVSPNDLRRTHATWLIQRGAPPNAVAFQLGHTSSAMVERVYGKLDAKAVGPMLKDRTDSVPTKGATMGKIGHVRRGVDRDSRGKRSRIAPNLDAYLRSSKYDSSALAAHGFTLRSSPPPPAVPLSYRDEGQRRALNRRFRLPRGVSFGAVLDAALELGGAAVSRVSGGRGASAISDLDRSASRGSEIPISNSTVSHALATPGARAGEGEGSGNSGEHGGAS